MSAPTTARKARTHGAGVLPGEEAVQALTPGEVAALLALLTSVYGRTALAVQSLVAALEAK